MSELLHYFQSQKQAMIDLLTQMIEFETPTRDKAHVDKLGAFMESQFKALGANVTRMPQEEVGDFLLAKWNEDAPGKPIMFLIHIDTVWPLGTLARRPVTIDENGVLFGPGAVDMKGGITIVLTTIRGLVERGQMPNRPVWVLMTSDEEIGSVYAIPTLEKVAGDCGLVLVMEPGTKDGALKTWRKGLATYKVHVEGRASHAGNAPEQGINAIVELAQQVTHINTLNDLKNGTSVSVTMIDGGSAGNVIPAEASAYVDTRFLKVREQTRVREALSNLPTFIPGAKVRLEEIHSRPPMEHNDLMKATVAQVRAVGEKYGVRVEEDGSGGGSDGNITAAMGIPTLDGMGPQGDGLHAEHEQVVTSSLPTRATLCAGLLLEWQDIV